MQCRLFGCCIIVGMSIQELSIKFKGLFHHTEFMLTVLIIVVSCVSFYLGRLSVGGDSGNVPIFQTNSASAIGTRVSETLPPSVATTTPPAVSDVPRESKYVASKSGTKYHLPMCAGAKQIKEENKVWFVSKEEAEKAGYTPAANCKGI